jgi:uncharacterized protein (DUF983 family)
MELTPVPPENSSDESDDVVFLQCPNCEETRMFPSYLAFMNKLRFLSEEEKRKMSFAITNYVGEKVAGRVCPFCNERTSEK